MSHGGQPVSKPTAMTLCLGSVNFVGSTYIILAQFDTETPLTPSLTRHDMYAYVQKSFLRPLLTTCLLLMISLCPQRILRLSLAHPQVYYYPLPFQTLPSVSSITYLPSPSPKAMMSSGRIIMPGSQPSLPELLNAAHSAAYWCVRSSTCCGSEVPWMMERIFTAPSSSMSLRIVYSKLGEN
jgi:hypothetical protein